MEENDVCLPSLSVLGDKLHAKHELQES